MTDGLILIEPVRAFLSGPHCAVLSTIGADGAPRQIVIHYLLGESHLRINGHRDRRWVANLRRDPRASLIIHDQMDYLHYVSIRGAATLLDEGDAAVAEAMSQAERYGEDPADFAVSERSSAACDVVVLLLPRFGSGAGAKVDAAYRVGATASAFAGDRVGADRASSTPCGFHDTHSRGRRGSLGRYPSGSNRPNHRAVVVTAGGRRGGAGACRGSLRVREVVARMRAITLLI